MVFCIERFSLVLCLAHATNRDVDSLSAKCFELTDSNPEDVYESIYKLGEIFAGEFESLFDTVFNDETLDDAEKFMKALLSRCVKFSKTPTYFQFLLTCSLIDTNICKKFTELKCFTYLQVASLCLRAVYNRCYQKLFKELEKFETLDDYCKRIKPFLRSKDRRPIPVTKQREISSLICGLRDIDDKNFNLIESELDMLKEIFNLVPVQLDDEPGTSTVETCESNRSLGNEIDRLELNKSKVQHFSVDRVCKKCKSKCYLFVIIFKARIQ